VLGKFKSVVRQSEAGIPRKQWRVKNKTGNKEAEERLTDQLTRNKLSSAGTPTVRSTGGK